MKKVLVALLLVGASGFVGWRLTWGSPVRRACGHMASLCHDDDSPNDTVEADCEKYLDELKRQGGAEAFDKTSQCIAEADTCATTIGCETGGVLSGVEKGMNDFFKGLHKGFQPSK